MLKTISERSRTDDPIDAPMSDSVTIFREAASGMGKLRLDSHEMYIEELRRGYK